MDTIGVMRVLLRVSLIAVASCVLFPGCRNTPPPVEEDGYSVFTSRSTEETVTPEPTPPVDVNTAGLEELDTLYGI